MKKICLLLFLLPFLQISSLHAQQDIPIALAIVNGSAVDNNMKSILKNKLLSLLSSEGFAGTECGAIILVPEVDVINSSQINGGMRRITSMEVGLTISVRHLVTGTVFQSLQLSAKGDGYSEGEAMRSAINKINTKSYDCITFVKQAKQKIFDYYKENTSSLITKANTLASQQSYDEAIALLSTYPESLPGYAQVSAAIVSIFTKAQTQYCSQILLSAKAAYAREAYDEVTEFISLIDAQSSCASEAQALLNSIKKDLEEQRAEAKQERLRADSLHMERMRSDERVQIAKINAAKDVASAYFQRQKEYVFIR